MSTEPKYHNQTGTLQDMAARLSVLLAASGKTALEVCREAGVEDASFSRWKAGKAEASWRAATSIALVLGRTPNDLMLRDAAVPAEVSRDPDDHAARVRIMESLDRLLADGRAKLAPVVADFLERVVGEFLTEHYPPGTVISKPEPGVKLLEAPKVAEKMKARGRKGGASQAGEGEGKYGKKKPRA